MKKDIKYIIKKIIIGVGIAFGVMLVKSLPVFADEKTYFIRLSGSSSQTLPSLVTEKKDSDIDVDTITLFNKYNVDLVNSTKNNAYYILFYSKNDNKYYLYYFGASDYFKEKLTNNIAILFDHTSSSGPYYFSAPNLYNLSNNDFLDYSSLNGKNLKDYEYDKDYSLLANYMGTSMYMVSVISENNDTLNLQELYSFNKQTCLNEDNISVVQSNLGNLVKFKDNILYDLYQATPPTPTGYEKIDMFNKYAILFYPKDFRNLPIECTKSKDGVSTDDDGNVTVIPNKTCLEESYKFTFYYSGYFNTAFTDLSVMDVVKNPVEQLTFPPTATPYELPLLRNINDFKGGIIFYNNSLSQITDDDGNVTTYYDKGYIYYDSSLFNYVIIEDYDTTPNQDISWIDKSGNIQNATINNIPKKNQTTLNEAQDTFDLFKNFKTNDHGLSSIITAPLSFIKNLSSATCTPVVLPIPFSKNQNVKLPCLTTMYEEKASSVYNIYKIVIIGITAYWVCVRIYALVKGFKDPNDDKIEVMEL